MEILLNQLWIFSLCQCGYQQYMCFCWVEGVGYQFGLVVIWWYDVVVGMGGLYYYDVCLLCFFDIGGVMY